ncbi:uncharacterized protein LOC130646055 [Hydractinia symbiolongicarpus]|uniref:uncharacterized protein LOC130646055 n=1 Tax=Hydractinia symbiolongicarpus TaxID=13093 RepID=UPI00254C4364|nr:uncharacterized protein LOC130646055 [Hydractinia symbiolongicarpus]
MVNCASCQRSFKVRVGKTKSTRCENCANFWREEEAKRQQNEREKKERENEVQIKELLLREKQMEMERQKVTIKETSRNGNIIELTCYYDQNTRNKITDLLAGARRALPCPPSSTPSDYQRRRLTNLLKSPEDGEFRRPRQLPSIDGLVRSRIAQRYKLEEDAGSSAGSGMSVD